MGQAESKTNKHDYSKFKERYEIKKKLIDKRYGEGSIVEDKTTKIESFLKEFTAFSSSQSQEILNKVSQKEDIKNKNPYIIEVIDYFTNKEIHYCSETYKTFVLFEFCNKNLEMEVNDRITDNARRFSNEELIYITESYIIGLSSLQKQNICHSALSLHSLLISKMGKYKVADQTILNMPSNYEQVQAKKPDLKGIYLSPGQLLGLKNNNMKINSNNYKNDVFILGMCLVHAASLAPCDDIFNYEELSWNQKLLDQKFETLKEFYSSIIINFLRTMTTELELERPDFIELNEHLDRILKIYLKEEKKTNNDFLRRTTVESIKLDRTVNMKRVHKDEADTMSALPLQIKTRMSTDFTPNQWKFDSARTRDHNHTASLLKRTKQPNQASIEHITEAKEDSELDYFNNKNINSNYYNMDNIEINDLLKEYGIEPLKTQLQTNQSKQVIISQLYPLLAQSVSQKLIKRKIENTQTSEVPTPFTFQAKNNRLENSSVIVKKSQTKLNAISSNINKNSQKFTPVKKSPNKYDNLSNSSKSGVNIDYFSNGSKYEGEKQNGIRNGQGRFTYVTGAYYEGEWKQNKKDGKGVLVNNDGKMIYDGFWMNDKYHGRGILYNANINFTNEEFDYEDFDNLNGRWLRFEGEFVEDEKHGKGLLYLINGERFYGNFEYDMANGNGSFYKKKGDVINGIWKNNKFYESS